MSDERRVYKRIRIFPMTIALESKSEVFYGFVTDLSQTGMLLCIHDPIENISDFAIKIPLPTSFTDRELVIKANQVRLNSLSNLDYNELGCKFIDISPIQDEQLLKLMSLLQMEENDDFDIPELPEIPGV